MTNLLHNEDLEDNATTERKKYQSTFILRPKNNGVDKKRNHYNPTLSEIREVMDLPLSNAAQELNICPTKLKKLCREKGIYKWPYRQVRI